MATYIITIILPFDKKIIYNICMITIFGNQQIGRYNIEIDLKVNYFLSRLSKITINY